MNLKIAGNGRRRMSCGPLLVALALTPMFSAPSAFAQTQPAESKPCEAKPASEAKPAPDAYRTIYLTKLTQPSELNDLVSDLRNVLSPKARIFPMQAQHAISLRGTPEDIELAQKIAGEMDRARKVYRLTYTIAESDSGKRTGTQSFSLLAASGEKTSFKQGSRVPIVTGTPHSESSTPASQVQYVDVGLDIDAWVDADADGARLRTKIEQSSLAEEKSAASMSDPVIRQTVLEETSNLVPGKLLVLGSLDIPGSTRRLEIEVVAELVP